MLNFDHYEALSFDCYGTLIDWETGITDAVRSVAEAHGLDMTNAQILSLYSEIEPQAQQGEYAEYRVVLRNVMQGIADRLGFTPVDPDLDCLSATLGDWPVFPDTVNALRALKSRYKLAILSNTDDGLFAQTAPNLGVEFDKIITSQQAGTYKPSIHNFILAIDHIGVGADRLLHVAESMFHDIVPAKSIGLSAVWVNRHSGDDSTGATRPVQGEPDLEVPDLATLVSLMGLG